MSTYRIVAVDENGAPLKGVTIVAYTLQDFPGVAARQKTDNAGQVIFTNLNGPMFFDAETRRGLSLRERNLPGRYQIQTSSFGNNMNADYIVDSNGMGTHASYAGPNGALAAAILAGTNAFIWICTTHVEPVITTAQSLDGMAANQVITVASGSQYRPTLPLGASIDLHPTSALAVSGTRIIYRNLQFSVASTFTANLFSFQQAGGSPSVELDHVDFSGAGTWQAIVINGAGQSGNLELRHCTGTVSNITTDGGTSRTLGNLGFNGNTGSGTKFAVRHCTMSVVNLVFRISDTHVEPASAFELVNNDFSISGYGIQVTYTSPFVFANNRIVHPSNAALLLIGTSGTNGMGSVSITGNMYDGSGGGNNTRFVSTHVAAGVYAGITITGNTLLGPGGTSIAIELRDFSSPSVIAVPNGFSNWGTNVGGAGAAASVSLDPTVVISGNADGTVLLNRMLVINDTGTAWSTLEWQRGGTREAYMGLWNTSGVAPFGANDFYVGTYDGAFHDVFAIQRDGTKLKFVNNSFIGGYLYVGQGSPWTAPTNTTAGDITGTRLIAGDATLASGVVLAVKGASSITSWLRVGSAAAPTNVTAGDLTITRLFVVDGSNFSLSQGASLSNIYFDTGDALIYNQTANRFAFQIGSSQYASVEAIGGRPFLIIGQINHAQHGTMQIAGGSADSGDTGRLVIESGLGHSSWALDAYTATTEHLRIEDPDTGTEYYYLGKTGFNAVGWGRFGSLAAPTNVTAGDLGVVRLLVGADVAIPVGTDALINGALKVVANVGFFNTAPQTQQVSGANLTNNVTVGGTSDQIDNFTDLLIYGNDAAAIRNDIYQLARKVKQINDGLRAYGLLT